MSSPTAFAGQKPTTALGRNQFFVDDLREHGLGVVVELAGGRALLLVLEDRGIAALELPGLEERRPVDVAGELGEVLGLEAAGAEEASACGGV